MLAIVVWDIARMWSTAWLTNHMVQKAKAKRREEYESRNRKG